MGTGSRLAAAQNIALQAVVAARKTGQPVTRTAVFEHLSECENGHHGPYLQHCAKLANHKTVIRLAGEMLRQQGEYSLIGF